MQGIDVLMGAGEHWFQYRFRHADGTYRWMQDAARLVRSEDGKPKDIVGYWIDVTDRGIAERALQRSEANFRTLIEHAPTATFVHRKGEIVYVNNAAIRMLGYDDASEMVGRGILDLIHPEDRAFIRGRMDRTIHEGGSPAAEARMIHRDGRTVIVEGEAIYLDFDGEPSSVVLGRDMTERREMFARVAVADRMLSVGTLAAGVAHEINNPLAYVMSNLALLSRELPALLEGTSSGRRRLSAMDIETLLRDAREGAERVSAIVRDLRALSRADDETCGPVDVAAVLTSSIKMAHNELRHRARVVEDLAPDLPEINANASRVGQVFLNLLVNAAQAIPDGHVETNEVRVRAHANPDAKQVVIEFHDTGVGISSSVIGRIFDPFFTTKPIGVGMGLGLSICHHIVRSMHGEISVTSEPGKGSCFRVVLPTMSESLASSVGSNEAGRSSTARILMVDDEVALGRSTRLLLAPEHDVIPVTHASEALRRVVRGDRFDVILCDLMMPEMSGIEFHQQLMKAAPEYLGRVVFITGGAFTKEARDFLEAVGSPHVEKPFTQTTLRTAIERIWPIAGRDAPNA
jgi:PAS domain S-box-containing protein